jgi:hypothetical protein
LEAALIDHDTITILALDATDDRSRTAEVAGAAALFVAKAHKIHDRLATKRADRLVDKDAADVLRLMQSTSARKIGSTLTRLRVDPMAGPVTEAAIAYIESLFGRRGRPGLEMATRAMRLAVPQERIEALSIAYTSTLISVARRG